MENFLTCIVVVTVGTTEADVGVTMVVACPGVMTVGNGEATVVGISMLGFHSGVVTRGFVLFWW